MPERILVTMALPYANGSIHLGHLVEAVQTDIYVRFLRLTGREAIFVCADDTHGAPIEINARKAGVSPEQFVARFHEEHQRDYAAFAVGFTVFHSTNSPENREWAERIYEALKQGGHLERRSIRQLHCPNDRRFLPDRYVKGTCPRCGAPDQYGDSCERCNAAYQPSELKEPRCALCGAVPELRESEHLFVRLRDFAAFLQDFVSTEGRLQPEIKHFAERWISGGLQDWCISRDGPYFGFRIPGETEKYFYVWLDAPIGYLSSTDHWARRSGREVGEWWGRDSGAEIIHFIGKDIVYFHTLFWPAMLEAARMNLPRRIVVHGMLTVNGEKMSKTRGTFINARQYLDAGLDPEALRYFYAANLGTDPADLDFSPSEFRNRVNADLVKTVGNFCQRALSFCAARFDGMLSELPTGAPHDALVNAAAECLANARLAYASLDLRRAVQSARMLAESGNAYLQSLAPWKLVEQDPAAAQRVITLAANAAKVLAVMLAPVLPGKAQALARQLGIDHPLRWEDGAMDWLNRRIGAPSPLFAPIDDLALNRLFAAPAEQQGGEPPAGAPKATVSIDDFARLDLRVGIVREAERVAGSSKLLKLSVDLGEAAPRVVAAGIAEHVDPASLPGRRVVVVANLAPRKIRGIESRGMVLAAESNGALALIGAPDSVAPGAPVR